MHWRVRSGTVSGARRRARTSVLVWTDADVAAAAASWSSGCAANTARQVCGGGSRTHVHRVSTPDPRRFV